MRPPRTPVNLADPAQAVAGARILTGDAQIPVTARIDWGDGDVEYVPGWAVAWRETAVLVRWTQGGMYHRESWLAPQDVERRGAPAG